MGATTTVWILPYMASVSAVNFTPKIVIMIRKLVTMTKENLPRDTLDKNVKILYFPDSVIQFDNEYVVCCYVDITEEN